VITFTVPGRPIPAARMTQATKWSKRARRSLDYQERVAIIAKSAVKVKPLPWRYVQALVVVYLKVNDNGDLPGNRGDWDNYGKSVCDGIQYGEVLHNDRAITLGTVDVQPCFSHAEERAEVTLSERTYHPKGA
jgi:crossover junction endodeoxyribonuclease RusA